MALNYQRLVSLYEHFDPQTANVRLLEQMGRDSEGRRIRDSNGRPVRPEVDPRNIDLGRLFCEVYGWNEFVSCRKGHQMAGAVFGRGGGQALTEAEGAVSTASFANITGQIV